MLLVGDVFSFFLALWAMLLLRYLEIPSMDLLYLHLTPFSILFVVWIIVFFIAGLYEKHTMILKSKIGSNILNAQIANSILALLFFYAIPYFGITPKTNLIIDLVLSISIVLVWRLYVFPKFEVKTKEKAILIGSGVEMRELADEVNRNSRYELQFISSIDLDNISSIDFTEEILHRLYAEEASVVAADFRNEKMEPLLPKMYSLIFSTLKFIDIHKLYEEIFDRIPLSLIQYNWFLENIAGSTQKGYDMLKRFMDLVLASILALFSLVFYPFVYIAIKIEDGGPIFFAQDRVGRNGSIIKVYKFRSMSVHNDEGGVAKNPIPTRVGGFLRKTRIDELPQLWNVLRGDLSLIGPRPEVPALVKVYGKEIPYYNVRHLIKPGLSGWAQLYQAAPPKFSVGYDETRVKLSYDLYYIKNRSLMLDLKIALRTIKALLSREGL